MSQKSQKHWKSRLVVLFLLASLISPVSLSLANTAQTLTICVSLKSGVQIISKSGNCNERLYEKVTWFQNGDSPQGTPGSKLISMTTCRSKSVGNTQVIKKSCNRTTQTILKWQRPLGPPEAPSIVSITPGNLGTVEIMVKAPENNGGARITSYSVVQFNNDVTSSKSSAGSEFLGTSAVSYPLKSREKISVGGLTPGESYRFAVVATNVAGTSQLSASSKELLVPKTPNAPTISSVTATGSGSALIAFAISESEFTAPITSFTITANPGGLQSTVTSPLLRSHTFNGLSPLTFYTFTMSANSEAGSSSPSEQSASVRTFAPQPPPEPIQTSSGPSAPAPIAAPVIALSSTSETSTAGVALAGYTIESTGGAVASYSISPSAPAGLTFNAITGLLSGSPTVVASSTTYTITGINATGSASATFTLTVTLGAPTFTLSSSSENRTVNTAATGFTATSTGGAVDSYSISPSAPAGMSFDTSTGAFAGTPTIIAGATVYTITATNATGSSTATFTLTVVVAAPAFTLSSSAESRATGNSLTGYTITSTGGAVASYSISPSAPAGLTFSTSTGLLSGSPTSVASATTYTITATNTSGTTTATFELTVTLGTPSFSLSSTSEARSAGTALSGYTISSTGGTIASYSISPSAPTGLTFNSSTGLLSGTPTVAASATTYTITATNATGNSTAEFVLTVNVGAATKAMITNEPAGAAAGAAFTTQPVIRITDASGNTVTSSTVDVVASIGSGSGTMSGTTTVAAVNGVATFTNLAISGSGNHTLTFTPTSLTAVTSNTFSVTTPLVPTKVAVTRASVGTTYGAVFTTQPQVTIQNENSATVSSSSATVTATISTGGALIGTTSVNAVNGVATFTNLGLKGKVGTAYTITYTVTGLTTATQSVTPSGGYSLGATGPGGGKVFYVATSGFSCGPTLTETCFYLEVAPIAANTRLDWAASGYKTSLAGASGTAIGSGYKNTLAIITQGNTNASNVAAAYAQAYRGGSLTDWYLGSTLELYQIYANRSAIVVGTSSEHGFAGEYWTSTEAEASKAYSYDVTNNSGPWPNTKNDNPVRPIRSF